MYCCGNNPKCQVLFISGVKECQNLVTFRDKNISVFWQTLMWVEFCYCYSHFQKQKYYRLVGYSSILFQKEGAKMVDSESTLFIASRFVPKQYTRIRSLLVFLFRSHFMFLLLKHCEIRSNTLPITCFHTLKLHLGMIWMFRISINRIHLVHMILFQSIFWAIQSMILCDWWQ